ncbi:zinc finger Ran-binding domain-containing protein 2 [Linepithema humile]|uniref:zinc finger Ran-binding domain-containing protein 2 n=1 Tax=Linepithema humile TaxID=83485 RepID=UPI00062342E3|nr:PREDICTED: cell wall integrity and stress response component 1-like [Linepithema humile]
MKNLGSRWTVPDIARTAAARSSFLVAISLERDSGSSSSSSSSSSKSSIRNRNKTRSSDSSSNGISNSRSRSSSSSSSSIRVTAIDKKRERKSSSGRSAIDVLHGAHLSVRPYVTAPCDRIVGTTRSAESPRNRPEAGKSRRSQHRTRRPRQPQQQLYYPPASWDTRTPHFRNC